MRLGCIQMSRSGGNRCGFGPAVTLATLLCCTSVLADQATVKIAVFPFELEDFSAAGSSGAAPNEAPYLHEATEEAERQLASSGRYIAVAVAGTDNTRLESRPQRDCGRCEVKLAAELGASQSLVGVVTKISMTEYRVRIQTKDAANGQILSTYSTDLRVGAPYAWSRGVRWLMQNQVLAER